MPYYLFKSSDKWGWQKAKNPQGGSGIKILKKVTAIFVSPMIVYRFNRHIFMSQGHAKKKHVGNRVCDFEKERKIGWAKWYFQTWSETQK